MEIIENNPNKPWKWNWIYYNQNISLEIIEKRIETYMDDMIFPHISTNEFTYENKRLKRKKHTGY